MARAADCIARVAAAAGRKLSDEEIAGIYERVHKAALDLKSGRKGPEDIKLTGALGKEIGPDGNTFVLQAAQLAAAEMQAESALRMRRANLQAIRLGATMDAYKGLVKSGMKPMDAAKLLIARDYKGRANLESVEQRVAGYRGLYGSKVVDAWKALGYDFLGFWQDKGKLRDLLSEMMGKDTGNALAKRGAKHWADATEEMRLLFNSFGGNIGKLDDWGVPHHHSQERVARAQFNQWMNDILPDLKRDRFVDDAGTPWSDDRVREFLRKAFDSITTNGHLNEQSGQFHGPGGPANRHSEARQLHFKDADAYLRYWEKYGEKSALDILRNHIDTMSRDIAFIEKFGPNPDLTFRTVRDTALKDALANEGDRTNVTKYEAQANRLESLWNYAIGRTKPTANTTFSGIADALSNLNVAAKGGFFALASLFGDKPMLEAVSSMNHLPAFQRWTNELRMLNPLNRRDRARLQQQGLMLESVRSSLHRFYDGLGEISATGTMANAVMRATGMNLANEGRKGAFGLTLMHEIGRQLDNGVTFEKLHENDVRTLRHMGVDEADWRVWQLAELDNWGWGNTHLLTPEAISRIPDGKASPDAKRNAIVKLLGAINTESEFAVVTPGWAERSAFYATAQRGTAEGEIKRAVLQFKSFPWTYFQRQFDAVANMEGGTSKTAMTAYLILASALVGAMYLQVREMLAGKDPRAMFKDPESSLAFWGKAFITGGAMGIYGDAIGSLGQARFGTGPLESLAGPTIQPLVEMGVATYRGGKSLYEGKDPKAALGTIARDVKGFVPGGNLWYGKAALDNLIWNRALESLAPGYLNNIRRRETREGQDRWWELDDTWPTRLPNMSEAIK